MTHITIDEIKSLTESEASMLLYICNVLDPIIPPISTPNNLYPISLNIIRCAYRDSILNRINKSESHIKEEAREIYNGLRTKVNLSPIVFPVMSTVITESVTSQVSEINNGPVTGSNIQ